MSNMKSRDPFLLFPRASPIQDSDIWEGGCTFILVESLSFSAVFLLSLAMLRIHFVSRGSVLQSALSS